MKDLSEHGDDRAGGRAGGRAHVRAGLDLRRAWNFQADRAIMAGLVNADGPTFSFTVYGESQEVSCSEYPAKCCCGCVIL